MPNGGGITQFHNVIPPLLTIIPTGPTSSFDVDDLVGHIKEHDLEEDDHDAFNTMNDGPDGRSIQE